MLAQSYDDRKSDIEQILDVGGIIYSQPKLDGIRCIIRKEDDKLVARTRKGRTIDSIPHIIKSLEPYFIDDKSLVLDGELYNHELNHDFNKIVSLVRKQTPTKSKSDTDKSFQKKLDKYKDSMVESEKLVQYHVYDIPKSDIFRRRHLFSERFFAIDIFDNEYIKMVHTKVASSFGDLDEHYKNYLSEGYEGQMIRINSGYDQGKRSAKLLKRKDFMDAEYQVVDISEGNGNRTGTAKHIVCYCEKTDQRFNSNIKGNFDYLAEILNNREEYIGKQATIKFFELTPDGVPRFPYAIAFRDYE
jgi:DNA ligase-1